MSGHRLSMARVGAGVAGLAGAVLVIVLGVLFPASFAPGYLAGALFVAGLPLGIAMLVLVHALTGGRWGAPVRSLALGAMPLLWLLAVLMAPVLIALRTYPWAGGASGEYAHTIEHWGLWMSPAFVIGRAVVALAVWALAGAWIMRRARHGAVLAPAPAGIVVIALVLTISCVAADWILSRTPGVPASIFGLTIVTMAAANAFALIVLGMVVVASATGHDPDAGLLRDLSAMLLAAVVLDFYTAFSQFLIVWNGNLPHEVAWYVPRFDGAWRWLTITVVVLRYAIPIPLLISGRIKRTRPAAGGVAALLLLAGALQAVWTTAPAINGPVAAPLLIAIGSLLALGGVAALVCLTMRPGTPLPRSEEAGRD